MTKKQRQMRKEKQRRREQQQAIEEQLRKENPGLEKECDALFNRRLGKTFIKSSGLYRGELFARVMKLQEEEDKQRLTRYLSLPLKEPEWGDEPDVTRYVNGMPVYDYTTWMRTDQSPPPPKLDEATIAAMKRIATGGDNEEDWKLYEAAMKGHSFMIKRETMRLHAGPRATPEAIKKWLDEIQ